MGGYFGEGRRKGISHFLLGAAVPPAAEGNVYISAWMVNIAYVWESKCIWESICDGEGVPHISLEALVVESVASLSAYQVSNTSEYHGTKMRVLKRVGRWQHLQDKCLWLDSVLTECSYLLAACKCGWEIIPDVSVSVLIYVITVIPLHLQICYSGRLSMMQYHKFILAGFWALGMLLPPPFSS